MSVLSSAGVGDQASVREDLRAALEKAIQIVGAERAIVALEGHGGPAPVSLSPNIGMFRPRRILGILSPQTPEQVRALVTTVSSAGGVCHSIRTAQAGTGGSDHANPPRTMWSRST
jgi:hypothetical protein